ncbi:MAG: SusE domain-containing protein [Candidatus Pseudobacter hemicellulosilyticus]|uniref:SusE domain-containing protein n=1 Tax=Candidatus Pseudobacter hemicellulosilyticus TaxID=3121375 RepID=A0AAJ5WZ24_9BACT|nr:MAG: SusE domain-containing protein [Pseudobacter sp.]
MRTIVHLLCGLLLLISGGCKKTGDEFTLQPDSFQAASLTSSVSTLVLQPATENDTVIRFQWSPAEMGNQTVITYTLQLDVPADTSGANAWGNASNFPVAANTYQHAFIGKDLNNLLNGRGLTADVANTIVVRIRAEVKKMDGAASMLAPVYSNTTKQTITSYSLSLYVPGEYQGWSPGTAPQLAPVVGRAGLYEGYVNITGTGKQYFKYTNAPDWGHTNYGDGGDGTFSTDGNAAGLSVPEGGYYYLTANLNSNTWTYRKISWGILGGATPGGWDTDTPLSYDAEQEVWTVTCQMKANGSFKFRTNNEWVLDFGKDNNGKLHYANNPFLGYTEGIQDLSVPEDGQYTITLDLHVAGQYTYSLQKH